MGAVPTNIFVNTNNKIDDVVVMQESDFEKN